MSALEVVTDFQSPDVNGYPVNMNDIIDDRLVAYVESLNQNLGQVGDQWYEEFNKFKSEIQNREYQVLNPWDIANNEYQEYNLGSEITKIAILTAKSFFKALANSSIGMKERFDKKRIVEDKNGKTYIKCKTFTSENVTRHE